MSHMLKEFRWALSILLLAPTLCAAEWPEKIVGNQSIWSNSVNRETQTRFIPTQLYVPSLWSGEQSVDLPQAGGSDSENTKWSGPEEWEDPYTKAKKVVYDRRRYNSREGEVVQKMAIRTDKVAIGRAFDSRFSIGGHSCDEEPKFPLGSWKQGEVRKFDYECRFNRSGTVTTPTFTVTLTIDEIDFEYGGTPHSLRFTWHLYSKTSNRVLDHKTYTFSPGKGMVSFLLR